jgi:membrane glycosyltransferase
MMPVLLGMVVAVPYTVLTSRASLGRALRDRGWLLTPEETAPPPELAAAARPPAGAAPVTELWLRVPQHAPLAMASEKPQCVPLAATRAA